MWYEILPSCFVITAALSLPGYITWHVHKLYLGNNFRRSLVERWDRITYQRDVRIAKHAYTVVGLEAIPDK